MFQVVKLILILFLNDDSVCQEKKRIQTEAYVEK